MSTRRAIAKKLLKEPEDKFYQIDLSTAKNVPSWCTRAFRNNRYHITINDNAPTTHGNAIKCMVQNHLDEPIRFHWRTMQRIKNEIFGDLINDHNIYWMWIFPVNVLPIPLRKMF